MSVLGERVADQRMLKDRQFAEMRLRCAVAWAMDNYWGYAPQSPQEIMLDVLLLLRESNPDVRIPVFPSEV